MDCSPLCPCSLIWDTGKGTTSGGQVTFLQDTALELQVSQAHIVKSEGSVRPIWIAGAETTLVCRGGLVEHMHCARATLRSCAVELPLRRQTSRYDPPSISVVVHAGCGPGLFRPLPTHPEVHAEHPSNSGRCQDILFLKNDSHRILSCAKIKKKLECDECLLSDDGQTGSTRGAASLRPWPRYLAFAVALVFVVNWALHSRSWPSGDRGPGATGLLAWHAWRRTYSSLLALASHGRNFLVGDLQESTSGEQEQHASPPLP